MKLLLTSNGLENDGIYEALMELAGKPAEETKVAFIPTAANPETGDKSWLVEHYQKFYDRKFAEFAIVDIAAVGKDIWLPELTNADVICLGGGDQQYLAQKLHESGVAEELPRLLQTRVYMGISAGSMVAGQFMPLEVLKIVYDYYPESFFTNWDPHLLAEPLKLVPIVFIPHMNSPHFQQIKEETILPLKGKLPVPAYALEDQAALKVVDGSIEVVGTGDHVVV